MRLYHIQLNNRQYSDLERILRANQDLTRKLAENKEMDGQQLLGAIVFDLEHLVKDGCGIDEFGIPILKTITAELYPQDPEYFVRQMGRVFHCDDEFRIKFEWRFS